VARRDRLIAKIRARPPEADYDDVRRLLEEFGWSLDRRKGSHVTFVKPGGMPITVPIVHGRKVKRVYLTLLCERLGLDE
jgi:predicted RNA binding protein YcfA (HicA-like mRNA interferase family)